jgi:hypothetical protein
MANEANVVEKAGDGATNLNGSEEASKFIGNLFNSGEKLDDKSAATASKGADTGAGGKQDTDTGDEKAYLQLQIGDEDLNIDLNNDNELKELHTKLNGEKLKLDSGEEFDLSKPEDLERLRNAGISGSGGDEAIHFDIEIGGQKLRYDLSKDEEIKDLLGRLDGGKLKLNDGTVLDLSKAEDVEKLRNSISPAESESIVELKFTKDGKQEAEKYDLGKKEDVEKILKYASGGRLFEVERAALTKEKEEFTGQKEVLAQHAEYVGYSILNLVSSGKMTSRDFMELPFEDFTGSSAKYDTSGNITEEATDAGDRKLWNEHNTQAKKNKESMIEYERGVKKMADDYRVMMDEFKTKHPEIEDLEKWVNESISPYHMPVVTFGKASYPKDTLEMIWTWKNLDKVLENARKEGRRDKATAVIKRDKQGSKIATRQNGMRDKAIMTARNIVSGGKANIEIAR